MLVSILIPCYNSAQYISETLDSVLAQTYTKWECIIVDDHSTDNSVEIINDYCQKYPQKFKLYTNPRKGACAARNTAFEKSKGEYIQYLDADDLLSPDKIESQIKLLDANEPYKMASSRWDFFYERPANHSIDRYIYKSYENPILLLVDMWTKGEMMANSAWLSHRQLIKTAGVWNEKLLINQDGEFFCRVLYYATSIVFSPNGKVLYRKQNPDSITKAPITFEKASSLLESYKEYEFILSKSDNPDIRRALAYNYLGFIYYIYPQFPKLLKEAEICFHKLGFNKKWGVGGSKFILTTKILGFNNTLKLKKLLM
jgi:glycosyltransferase involved in cell wall biosynthesis